MIYLFTIIFIAFINRILFLFQPIRYDEAFSFIVFANKSLSVALSNYQITNNHLLNTFFEHIFFRVFGPMPEIIRQPAFIAGLLIIPANYAWVKKIYDENTALISCALLAASSILIEFSTNARGYTLMILFSILALSSVHKLISSQLKRGYLWFIISSSLGFYAIPTFFYLFGICIASLSIYIIPEFRKGSKINIKPLLISLFLIGLLTLLLYLPIFLNAKKGLFVSPFLLFTRNSIFTLSTKAAIIITDAARQWVKYIPSVAVILCNFILLISFINKELRKKHLFLIMPMVTGCLAVSLLMRKVPDTSRHLLFLLPIYYALVGASLAWLINILVSRIKPMPKINMPAVFALFLALLLSLRVIDAYSKQPREVEGARDVVIKLRPELKSSDRVFSACPVDAPLAYYFYISGIAYSQICCDWKPPAKRIFVVINHEQDLKGVFNLFDLSPEIPARLVGRFSDLSLYVIDKKEK